MAKIETTMSLIIIIFGFVSVIGSVGQINTLSYHLEAIRKIPFNLSQETKLSPFNSENQSFISLMTEKGSNQWETLIFENKKEDINYLTQMYTKSLYPPIVTDKFMISMDQKQITFKEPLFNGLSLGIENKGVIFYEDYFIAILHPISESQFPKTFETSETHGFSEFPKNSGFTENKDEMSKLILYKMNIEGANFTEREYNISSKFSNEMINFSEKYFALIVSETLHIFETKTMDLVNSISIGLANVISIDSRTSTNSIVLCNDTICIVVEQNSKGIFAIKEQWHWPGTGKVYFRGESFCYLNGNILSIWAENKSKIEKTVIFNISLDITETLYIDNPESCSFVYFFVADSAELHKFSECHPESVSKTIKLGTGLFKFKMFVSSSKNEIIFTYNQQSRVTITVYDVVASSLLYSITYISVSYSFTNANVFKNRLQISRKNRVEILPIDTKLYAESCQVETFLDLGFTPESLFILSTSAHKKELLSITQKSLTEIVNRIEVKNVDRIKSTTFWGKGLGNSKNNGNYEGNHKGNYKEKGNDIENDNVTLVWGWNLPAKSLQIWKYVNNEFEPLKEIEIEQKGTKNVEIVRNLFILFQNQSHLMIQSFENGKILKEIQTNMSKIYETRDGEIILVTKPTYKVLTFWNLSEVSPYITQIQNFSLLKADDTGVRDSIDFSFDQNRTFYILGDLSTIFVMENGDCSPNYKNDDGVCYCPEGFVEKEEKCLCEGSLNNGECIHKNKLTLLDIVRIVTLSIFSLAILFYIGRKIWAKHQNKNQNYEEKTIVKKEKKESLIDEYQNEENLE